jgi:hemerythrin
MPITDSLKWDSNYLIGDEIIDAQHLKLFQLVNDLIRSCEDGTGVEKLNETLGFLVVYTMQHFGDEEALQIKYNYPLYEEHKKAHEEFKVTVGELVQRFKDGGSSSELNRDITRIAIKWLIGHILNDDKKFGVFLKSCR